jgi:hypothetical protein
LSLFADILLSYVPRANGISVGFVVAPRAAKAAPSLVRAFREPAAGASLAGILFVDVVDFDSSLFAFVFYVVGKLAVRPLV